MKKEYRITEDQLETINHYKKMFDINSDRIQELCNSEKDDIVYGFELGMIYSHLRECFMEMGKLEDKIKRQTIENEPLLDDKYHFNEENIL